MASRLTFGQLVSSLTYCCVAFLLSVGMCSCIRVFILKYDVLTTLYCLNHIFENVYSMPSHYRLLNGTYFELINYLFCFLQQWWRSRVSLWTPFECQAWFPCSILGQCFWPCQGSCLEVLSSAAIVILHVKHHNLFVMCLGGVSH